MATFRNEKLQEILRNEIANILQRKYALPGRLLTVNKVEVARKGEHAAVYVSVFPSSATQRASHMLRAVTFAIQQDINKKLQMHPVPKLRFVLDESVEKLAHIDEVLRTVHNVSSPQTHATPTRRKLRKTVRPA